MAKVEVFSSPDCHYCEQAKALLQREGIAFETRDIAHEDNLREFTRRLPRVRAVPQIFIDGEHIGGFEDLELMRSDGRLDRLEKSGRPV